MELDSNQLMVGPSEPATVMQKHKPRFKYSHIKHIEKEIHHPPPSQPVIIFPLFMGASLSLSAASLLCV